MDPLSIPLSSWQASLARDSLPDFIRQAWYIVEPTRPLIWNWHLDVLCDVLTKASEGKIKRIVINVPPGTGKSMFVTVMWNAWEWIIDPSLRYFTAAYTDVNTIRDNRRLRTIITSDWYEQNFWNSFGSRSRIRQVRLASDQSAKVRFDTTERGWRIATGVGGAATGEHSDRIIIDDPLKALGSRSKAELDECNEWFDGTISTRIALDPVIVIVMQRLHMNDLCGHVFTKGGWTHVCLPMRYEPTNLDAKPTPYIADPRDIRKIPGELLWPEKWPEEKVRQEEIDLGQFAASGQLQQRPVPVGGGIFKREWFTPVDTVPIRARHCRGWDTADTPGGGNWTVGTKLAYDDETGITYVVHNVRDQTGPGGVNALIKTTAELDGDQCLVREGSGSGKATILARSKMLARYDYAAMPETVKTGNKVQRANPFRAQCEMGNVRMVRGIWNDAYLDVMTSFPVGKYDDDCDSTSNAYNGLVVGIQTMQGAVWGSRAEEASS
jgi:predicted phage terminase large subunit-like protein